MKWLYAAYEKVKGWFIKEKTLIDHWFETDERLRFGILASLNMAFRYVLFVVLGIVFKTLHYQLVLLMMWLFSSVVAFYSYKIFVFGTSGNHVREYAKSVLIWSVSYVINAGILSLLVGRLHLNIYLSQAVAISVLFILNYLLFKHFAFRQAQELSRWEKFLEVFDIFRK